MKVFLPRTFDSLPALLPYGLVLLVISLATLALHFLRGLISLPILALLYLLVVAFCTLREGLGPGVLASFISFLAYNYFFIQPYYSLWVHQWQDLVALLVYLVIAVIISQMMGQTQKSLAAVTAREHEAVRLYELSATLAGLNQDRLIVQTLARHTFETFGAERVEVIVDAVNDRPLIRFSLPEIQSEENAILDPNPHTLLIPLQTNRALLGEIRIIRSWPAFSPSEERLARTFASQSIMALERANLVQADTRARVLEESDRLKSALLSSVSHEFRTPLATIKAAVTSLRGGEVDWESEARGELLAAVEEETDHLNQLVSNLLNMSRIEAGALDPSRHWNVLSEIVAGVVHRFKQVSPNNRIEVNIPDELPLVPVDYILMEQVFTNLISNSLKYSPEGSIVRIQVQPLDTDQSVQVQVFNQGPHVPEEHLSRIFDKFYRVTAAERVTGTGLGLSICKGIVEAHGGRIWAENLPDGFAFQFTIPVIWNGTPPMTSPMQGVNE